MAIGKRGIMTDKLKLIGAPEEAPTAAQPQFPHTNLQFAPIGGGFAVQILLAPDISITKAFDGEAEEQITDILIKRRKDRKAAEANSLALVRRVNASRND